MTDRLSVVVGRFQVDEPHEGHIYLLDYAGEQNSKLLIVLGSGPLPTTARKPLPFKTRQALLRTYYPDALYRELPDHHSDEVWSQNLDSLIADVLTREMNVMPHENRAVLYHSRDSFKHYYSGMFPTEEVEAADLGVSGTLHRKRLSRTPLGSRDFARGVIWANENRFPTVYSAVDAAIFRHREWRYADNELLLITKTGRDGLMFPGGFAEPSSVSDEEDVAREVLEECDIVVASEPPLRYIGSKNVNDWRYDGELDCIRSRMYLGYAKHSEMPVAGDDADTANYYQWSALDIDSFNPCHQPLFQQLHSYVFDNLY